MQGGRVITIGVDAHKRIHVALAVNDDGQEVAQWRGSNSPNGWASLAKWAADLGEPRQWGIEGAWGNGRGLAQLLVDAQETVFEINARWTALGRRRARKPGKTDGLDARTVALLVRQESPRLPRVLPEDVTALLDLLTTQREDALNEATRIRNQIHAIMVQLDPEYHRHLPSLQSKAGLKALETYPSRGSMIQRERATAVRRLAARLRLALDQAAELAKEIKEHAKVHLSPLTRLCGVNLLTAGALAGILGPGHRFGNDAELAAYAGVAPLEASSAGVVRHRLNRGGNRRLNSVLYMIALSQARHSLQARTYLDRRVSEGKSRREAIRALKRFIVRAIWHLWQDCQPDVVRPIIELAA
jgi:transposase